MSEAGVDGVNALSRPLGAAQAWTGTGSQPPSRVPYLDESALGPDQRHLLVRPINLFRGLANSPGALAAHHQFGEWIRWECGLDPRLREMIILHVGYLADSPYEYSHHLKISEEFGVSRDDVADTRAFADTRAPGRLTDAERAALDVARELVESATVSDATWARLERWFGSQDQTDIVVVASFYCYVVRVLAALRLEVEDDWAAPLDDFPLHHGRPRDETRGKATT